MTENTALYLKDKTQWRKWLKTNHKNTKEVWLIHYKKPTNKKSVSHIEAVEEALCFGWIDSKLKKIDEEKFILKYSPRKQKSIWSKINKEKAEELIASGKMTQTGLEKIEEAKKQGFWDKAYTNLERERLPSDLKNSLMKNEKAWNNFKKFANSYRNMYIGWVKGAKTEKTRIRRISQVVKWAAQNKKLGIE